MRPTAARWRRCRCRASRLHRDFTRASRRFAVPSYALRMRGESSLSMPRSAACARRTVMPLFRHLLRPLTHVGRVLWCVALSLLAAVLLLVSPPTQADDSEATKTESPYFFV